MSIRSTGSSDWEGALVVKPRTAWKMLSCSNTRGYELLNSGELVSFKDGKSRKITVASIKDYIARRTVTPSLPHRQRGRPRRTAPQLQPETPA
jgi:hypothetical protein